MRTQEQILERIRQVERDDWMGTQRSDLVGFLTYDNAKPFLKETCTEDKWTAEENTKEKIQDQMLKYMPFAWDKANNCRGISANRSIDHMMVWLWLYDDEELYSEIEAIEFEHYGKEKLIAICEHFGWDWKQWDDGVRTNTDY